MLQMIFSTNFHENLGKRGLQVKLKLIRTTNVLRILLRFSTSKVANPEKVSCFLMTGNSNYIIFLELAHIYCFIDRSVTVRERDQACADTRKGAFIPFIPLRLLATTGRIRINEVHYLTLRSKYLHHIG